MAKSRKRRASRQSPKPPSHDRLRSAGLGVLIALVAVVAYHNSLDGPFLFDDRGSIIENPTIRSLWPIWGPLMPPTIGQPVGGRPVFNLSLAINYALGELDVWGYHAMNLAVHVAAA